MFCQTPDVSRNNSGPSWAADLDVYIVSHEGTSGSDSSRRHELVSSVKSNPQSAEAWRLLLAYEESHGGNLTHTLSAPGADSGKVSLYHIYYWATQLVPRSKNQHKEAYLQLWLGFVRQQWVRSQEDARDTFKTLKNQLVGDGSAHLYYEWASLEHAAGNVSKALGIIAKGLRSDAQPASLLEQLRAEMQSGTFDLKTAGPFTETLTLDAGSVAARQFQQTLATPAPTAASAYKNAGLSVAGVRPATASCLKASIIGTQAATHGLASEHNGRAVTFAADVVDATGPNEDYSRRPGSASDYSARTAARAADGHTGCLSASSTSSRSTASVHDGTLPFSSGAVSYKSSTTESSSMGGLEEDTISCQAAGAAAGTAGKDTASKPNTAPLNGQQAGQGASTGSSNTATLGLKRFGFKSRALRVGGSDGPGRVTQAAADAVTDSSKASAAMPPPAPVEQAHKHAIEPAGSSLPATQAPADDDAAAGKKRRAGEGSSPVRNTSPKLDTAHSNRRPGGAQLGTAEPQRLEPSMNKEAAAAHSDSARTQAGVVNSNRLADAGRSSSSEEDSVPLVSSKLAAKLAHDRGTPVAAGRPQAKHAGWLGMGDTTPPVEGQLPSSIDNTPEPIGLGDCLSGPTHSGAAITEPAASSSWCKSQQQQWPPKSSTTAIPCSQPASNPPPQQGSRTASRGAAAADAIVEEQPLPTIVLPDVPAVQPASSRHPSSNRTSTQQQQPQQAQVHHQLAQQQQPRDAAHAGREPLRPLQAQQSASSSSRSTAPDLQKQQTVPKQPPPLVNGSCIAAAHNQPQQEHLAQHQRPESQPRQQQQHQQEQLMGPPPPVLQQQQQPVRQSRPREDAQTVYVQGTRYTKLECVGRGGSSKVFKVMGPSCKIYALKRIRLAGRDAEAASGFIDEINLLLSLKNKPNIIQLVESQVFQEEGLIYMVQEYGEIDLARLLAKHDAARRAAAGSDAAHGGLLKDNLDENFIRLYWQQMLQAVSGVHEQRIVHSDLKPANFLLVEGQLKLIDFGIAKAINGDTTSIARESQVGTLNYMSPEAILGGSNNILGGPAMKVGRPSDVWSLGCILYQMVYGRTPFADLPFLPKMHAICNPQHQVAYPALANTDLLDVMKRCLDRDAKTRITLQELLDHPFLHPNRRRLQNTPPAKPVGLSEEQMKLLVAQVAAAGAAGVTDIDKLTRDLMQKLGTAAGSASGSTQQQPAKSGQNMSRIPTAPRPVVDHPGSS